MSSVFFVDAYAPVIRRSKKEPRWLEISRAVAATVGIGALVVSLSIWCKNIIGKEVHSTTTTLDSIYPNMDRSWLIPNARICLLDSTYDDMFQKYQVEFNVGCKYSTSNNNFYSCQDKLTKLRGYDSNYYDLYIEWDNEKDAFYPWWRNGYCYHFSGAEYNEGVTAQFDLYISGNSTINPTDQYFLNFDITFFDPRFDPMSIIYNIPNNMTISKSSYGTAMEIFLDDDLGLLPNEYSVGYGLGQAITFTPFYNIKSRNHPWNYIGVYPLSNQYWDLNTQSTSMGATTNAQGTVTISTLNIGTQNSQSISMNTTPAVNANTETRPYTIIAMAGALYIVYMGATHIIQHFFGRYGSTDGLFAIFIDQVSRLRGIDLDHEDSIPFSNLPEKNKQVEDEKEKSTEFRAFDVETLTRRLLNLETILAECYIDASKVDGLSKGQYPTPLTTRQKIMKFVKAAVTDVKDAEKDISDMDKAFEI